MPVGLIGLIRVVLVRRLEVFIVDVTILGWVNAEEASTPEVLQKRHSQGILVLRLNFVKFVQDCRTLQTYITVDTLIIVIHIDLFYGLSPALDFPLLNFVLRVPPPVELLQTG